MFEQIKQLWAKKAKPQAQPKPERAPAAEVKSAKDQATQRGEPYVAIVSMDIDPNNLHQGSFELDWNDKFVANLVRTGYQIKSTDTDADIVDRWFQNVCRHVVMETWEQEQAIRTSGAYVQSRDVGGGRREVS